MRYFIFLVVFSMSVMAYASNHGSSTIPYTINTANNNISIGPGTLAALTTGTQNVAVGLNTGIAITTGSFNTIFGNGEGVLTTGANNVFIGVCAAALSSTTAATCLSDNAKVGTGDVAIGDQALLATATNGNYNVGVGSSALAITSSGLGNTAVGGSAGGGAYTGNYNTFYGYKAGNTPQLLIGNSNVVIGPYVGSTTLQNGSYNLLIGVSTAIDATTSSASNEIHIGGTGGDWVTVTGTNNSATEGTVLSGKFNTTGLISGGTKFTMTGCSATTAVGGATAGTYTSGTTGTCAVVITMNGATGLAAPTGWDCHASDRTTVADLQQTTASSTTTATISGATLSGDVISFNCIGY